MEKGIEKFSGVIMPGLLLLVIGIAVYSLTLRHTDGETLRTGLQGLAVYVKPDFRGMTLGRFLQILLDAMSQLFFSLSVSMGIMITYGSYVKKDVDLNVSLTQIELFDTLAAFLAGMMIIPAVFVFSGTEGMGAGPSLMFVSLPKVFRSMGPGGNVVGALFFYDGALCRGHLQHLHYGDPGFQLHGNLPSGPEENEPDHRPHFRGGRRGGLPGV